MYIHPQTQSLQCLPQQWLFVFVLKITLGTSSVTTHHSAPETFYSVLLDLTLDSGGNEGEDVF